MARGRSPTGTVMRRMVAAARGLDGPQVELECGHRLDLIEAEYVLRKHSYHCPLCDKSDRRIHPHEED